MANLSNINNILRTGSLGVGINRDPLGAFEISSATKPGIKMFNTAAGGKTYEAYSDANGNYIIYDQDADDNRFVINSSGNATFAGSLNVNGQGYFGPVGTGNATTKAEMQSNAVLRLKPHDNNSTNMNFAQVNNGAGIGIQTTNGPGTASWDIALSPFGGKVGIGTAAPSETLQVNGNIRVAGVGNAIVFDTTGANSSNGIKTIDNYETLIFNQRGSAGFAVIGNSNIRLGFGTNYADSQASLVINSSGEVGIGETNPSWQLEVSDTGTVRNAITSTTNGTAGLYFRVFNSGTQVGNGTIATQNNGDMKFFTGTSGEAERMRIKSDGHILVATTNQIQFYNTDQYIRASSTNDLDVVALDDINYRSNFSRFFSGSAEHARLTGIGGISWVVNGSATHKFGVGTTAPVTKCWVKDNQDSSLFSGVGVERSANTTGVCLNAVGGALNLNTSSSSMPLKFRIQDSSMQTINTDGGRAYAANASGLNMKEYGYNFSAVNGAVVDLFENSSAHSDITMVQISITAYHSSRTFFAGMGTFGGYGFHLTGAGNGLGNGGLTSTSTGTGTRKLQWANTSGYNAAVRIYIQIRTESGITVLNGTLSTL